MVSLPQMIIYLDQNKWIELARMMHGKDGTPRAKQIVDEFIAAVDSGAAVVPLSAIHYMEMARIKDAGRRSRLGEVMWRLSKGYTLASYPEIVRHEISRALRKHFPQVREIELTLIGRGVSFAFGEPEPKGTMAIFNDAVERAILCGSAELGAEAISVQSREHQGRFQNHLRGLREKVAKVEKEKREDLLFAMLLADIVKPLEHVVRPYGIGPDDFFKAGIETARAIVLDMPTRKLDYHFHKLVLANAQYSAKITDLEDWAGVGVAANYCDVVVCEKHMADMIRRAAHNIRARIETGVENTFLAAV